MDEAVRLSQTGAFVGSLHYAAPEQFHGGGKDLDGRTLRVNEARPRSERPTGGGGGGGGGYGGGGDRGGGGGGGYDRY